MTKLDKIIDFSDLAEKVVEQYYVSYPQTSADMVTVACIMMDAVSEIEKNGWECEKYIPDIIRNVHRNLSKGSEANDSFGKIISDLFGTCKTGCKHEQSGHENGKGYKCSGNGNSCNGHEVSGNCEKKECCGSAENRKRKCNDGKTHVSDTDNGKTIHVLMPGVDKNQVSVTVGSDGILSVGLKDVVFECPFVNPDLRYEFYMDDECDVENAKSSLKNGILTIFVPKKEKVRFTLNVE